MPSLWKESKHSLLLLFHAINISSWAVILLMYVFLIFHFFTFITKILVFHVNFYNFIQMKKSYRIPNMYLSLKCQKHPNISLIILLIHEMKFKKFKLDKQNTVFCPSSLYYLTIDFNLLVSLCSKMFFRLQTFIY